MIWVCRCHQTVHTTMNLILSSWEILVVSRTLFKRMCLLMALATENRGSTSGSTPPRTSTPTLFSGINAKLCKSFLSLNIHALCNVESLFAVKVKSWGKAPLHSPLCKSNSHAITIAFYVKISIRRSIVFFFFLFIRLVLIGMIKFTLIHLLSIMESKQ